MEPKFFFCLKKPQNSVNSIYFPQREIEYPVLLLGKAGKEKNKHTVSNKTLIQMSWFQQFCYTLR